MRPRFAFALSGLLAVAVVSGGPLSAGQAQSTPPPSAGRGTLTWPDAATLAERKRDAERRRLFRSEDPLTVTLSADFRAVNRDRDPKSVKTFPATISFPANDGSIATMPLQIRTRGHARRNPVTCTFAPLRLEFNKQLTKGTVFDGHGALKLGTHCRNGSEEVILREYVVYQMFNRLTPQSFRARLASMTYVDTATNKTVATEMGLLIEDDDDVAKRMEGRVMTIENVIFARVDQHALTLMMLFEYLIGNTDFSIAVQHNVRLVQTPTGRRYAVPYDFDYSGLVDAAYSVPAKDLGISSVRDRLYRGPCRTPTEWQPYLDQMNTARPAFLEMFEKLPGLSDRYRRDAKNYLEDFYKKMAQPFNVKKLLIEPCIKVGM